MFAEVAFRLPHLTTCFPLRNKLVAGTHNKIHEKTIFGGLCSFILYVLKGLFIFSFVFHWRNQGI